MNYKELKVVILANTVNFDKGDHQAAVIDLIILKYVYSNLNLGLFLHLRM